MRKARGSAYFLSYQSAEGLFASFTADGVLWLLQATPYAAEREGSITRSLAKIFRAINRFSEDIDRAVNYVALGFDGEKDRRWEGLTKTKRAAILKEMMAAYQQYIGGEFLAILRKHSVEIIGQEDRGALKSATRTGMLWSSTIRQRARKRCPTLLHRSCAGKTLSSIVQLPGS